MRLVWSRNNWTIEVGTIYLRGQSIIGKSKSVRVKLFLVHFQDESKVHFIYSPHLDLTGYGNSVTEAKESFEIVFEDFVDYTIKKKTLAKVLTGLGWVLKGTEKHPKKVIASQYYFCH